MSSYLLGGPVLRQFFLGKMVILNHISKFHKFANTFATVIILLALHLDCSTENYCTSNLFIIIILHFKTQESSFCTTLEGLALTAWLC